METKLSYRQVKCKRYLQGTNFNEWKITLIHNMWPILQKYACHVMKMVRNVVYMKCKLKHKKKILPQNPLKFNILHNNDRGHPTIPHHPHPIVCVELRTKHGRSIQNRPEYASTDRGNTHFPPQIPLHFICMHFAPLMLKNTD